MSARLIGALPFGVYTRASDFGDFHVPLREHLKYMTPWPHQDYGACKLVATEGPTVGWRIPGLWDLPSYREQANQPPPQGGYRVHVAISLQIQIAQSR